MSLKDWAKDPNSIGSKVNAKLQEQREQVRTMEAKSKQHLDAIHSVLMGIAGKLNDVFKSDWMHLIQTMQVQADGLEEVGNTKMANAYRARANTLTNLVDYLDAASNSMDKGRATAKLRRAAMEHVG